MIAQCKHVFLLAVFSMVCHLPLLHAQTLPPIDIEKLRNAQRLADRVYSETGDAKGAANVLEEAGIARLKKGRPSHIDINTYTQLLEAYAAYLVKLNDRRLDAAELLKTVIENDSGRISAYLSLGDLYHQLYREDPRDQYRAIYVAAYKKYVGQLSDKQQRMLLPPRIVNAVYGTESKDICEFTGYMIHEGKWSELEAFFNPETSVEVLNQATALEKGESGISFSSFVESSVGDIRKSLVDVDNDGQQEIRYTAATVKQCRRNLFYKHFGKQSALLSNALFDDYFKGERLCDNSRLLFVQYRQRNYVLEAAASNGGYRVQVHELLPSGQHQRLCAVSPPSALQTNMTKRCELPVCDKLALEIDAIVAAEAQHGAEWLTTDIGTLKFSIDQDKQQELQPYIDSPHQYLADLDNDGVDELISRLWQGDNPDKLHYSHRLFRQKDGVWSLWQPADVNLPFTTRFFVKPYNDLNHIVTYTASPSNTGAQSATVYSLIVILIENGRVQRLGELKTFQ